MAKKDQKKTSAAKTKAALAKVAKKDAAVQPPMPKSGVVIRPCACKNEYQDERYGVGHRVHNIGKAPASGRPPVSCTVCGNTKD